MMKGSNVKQCEVTKKEQMQQETKKGKKQTNSFKVTLNV